MTFFKVTIWSWPCLSLIINPIVPTPAAVASPPTPYISILVTLFAALTNIGMLLHIWRVAQLPVPNSIPFGKKLKLLSESSNILLFARITPNIYLTSVVNTKISLFDLSCLYLLNPTVSTSRARMPKARILVVSILNNTGKSSPALFLTISCIHLY